MRVRADVIQTGKTTTGIQVLDAFVAELRVAKRPPVTVTIDGYTDRTTIAPMGVENWISVSAEVRERAGIAGGNTVDIDVELDTEPRKVAVPADLAEALDREPEAKSILERLSYSNKRRHVLSIEGAKTPETRQRRIVKVIDTLRAGRT